LDDVVAKHAATIFRWMQAYAADLDKQIRPYLRLSNGSWRVDKTSVKVKGRWLPNPATELSGVHQVRISNGSL
jgi:transposase-like protein